MEGFSRGREEGEEKEISWSLGLYGPCGVIFFYKRMIFFLPLLVNFDK